MSFIGDLSSSLGFSKPDAHTVDSSGYAQSYNQAIADLQAASDPTSGLRNSIYSNTQQQAGQLDNMALARRKAYADDMNRNFAGQTQSVARAKGGTGTLQQALRPSSEAVAGNNRAIGRGFLDLQSQALQDLGSLQGIQGAQFGQDMARQQGVANARMGQATGVLNQSNQNAEFESNAENQQAGRLNGTLQGTAKAFGVGGFGQKGST